MTKLRSIWSSDLRACSGARNMTWRQVKSSLISPHARKTIARNAHNAKRYTHPLSKNAPLGKIQPKNLMLKNWQQSHFHKTDHSGNNAFCTTQVDKNRQNKSFTLNGIGDWITGLQTLFWTDHFAMALDDTKRRAGGPGGLEGRVPNWKTWIFGGLH